ncbi:MAG TPA: hypothetical protein VNM90_14800 [Haliangium sp.]|nr:hypothetical protein [Haliangium sp.]
MRRSWLVLGLGLAILSSPSCRDKEKKNEPPPVPVDVTGLAAVPAAVRVVVGVNVEAIADAWLVERAVEQMFLRDPGLAARVDDLITACRFDPGKDLRTLALALGAGANQDQALMVATGNFSEPEVAACVRTSLTEDGGTLSESEVDGRRFYQASARSDRADSVWFTFGDPKTLVVATSSAWLAEAVGKGDKVLSRQPMAGWIERADPNAGIWAAGALDEKIGRELVALVGGLVSPPRALLGHIHLKEGLAASLSAIAASAEDAQALVALTNMQLRVGALALQRYGLGPLVSKLTVAAEGDTLHLRLALTEEELKDVLSRIDTTPAPAQDTPSGKPASEGREAEPDAKSDTRSPGPAAGND